MSLKYELEELVKQSGGRVSEDARKIMAADLERLVSSGLAQKGPHPGEKLADFVLCNQLGKKIALNDLRASGPVILSFYRGGW